MSRHESFVSAHKNAYFSVQWGGGVSRNEGLIAASVVINTDICGLRTRVKAEKLKEKELFVAQFYSFYNFFTTKKKSFSNYLSHLKKKNRRYRKCIKPLFREKHNGISYLIEFSSLGNLFLSNIP